ncbi:MAG TPA: UDP-N-acetylmuramate dehydrogenase [Bacteroidetes bacterium]|nr:UDP-N-acetylmuramate dehydrogenase [Bacteroidota bacterium]
MESIRENFDLQKFNTFGIPARARYFLSLTSGKDLSLIPGLLKNQEILILGGGSNVLFRKDFEGMVIHPVMKGIRVMEEDRHSVLVQVMAGENWDRFVAWTVERGWGGLENLSYIPGNTGASPIQNIGAYGVEVKDHIEWVNTLVLADGEHKRFDQAACRFGYRDSIFKNEWKGRVLVVSVVFRLMKRPVLRTDYARVEEEMQRTGLTGLAGIRAAVIQIRKRKLPDPAVTGNAGSFFKNPVIPVSDYENLKKKFPEIPGYPAGEDRVKTAAAWLIDRCGWKGYREGDAGVHNLQPLVLVNHGKATGQDIYDLSEKILESVRKKFGIVLEREVTVI